MKKRILRRLSVGVMILILTTVFSFAANEPAQNGKSYGLEPVASGVVKDSAKAKEAIRNDANSSNDTVDSNISNKAYGSYGTIYSPAAYSCYGLADTINFNISVRDTYDDAFTCPVVAIYNANKLVEYYEGDSAANTTGWTNYKGSAKLHLSKYTSGTHWFWLINWPCDQYGNLYDVDDWYKYCEWINVPFYIGPYGKVTILNTVANSAKRTNDVIWSKSGVKGANKYEINWRARGASKWASRTVGNVTRGVTSGLTVGNLYEIRVRPKKGGIGGKWSNTVYRYFHTTQRIRLRSTGKGSFTMSWARNPQATGYQVMFSTNKNGAGAAKNINTVSASATSFTKRGLQSGRTYYVQVRELRKVGGTTYIGNISIPVAVRVR